LRDSTVTFEQAKVEKAGLGGHQNDAHVGKFARFSKGAKAQKGVLAGELFHGGPLSGVADADHRQRRRPQSPHPAGCRKWRRGQKLESRVRDSRISPVVR
jgi:hypothetical protein